MIPCHCGCGELVEPTEQRRHRNYATKNCRQRHVRALEAEAEPGRAKPCRCDAPLFDSHEDEMRCIRCGRSAATDGKMPRATENAPATLERSGAEPRGVSS